MRPKPRITYFDIRGRAEPIRLLLEEVGVEYEDLQITQDQWQELKPRMPFGQLPVFTEGNVELVQSHAIYRHLARIHDLYGDTEDQRVRCDIAIEALRDADEDLGAVFWRPDFEEHRKKFLEDALPRRLSALARFLAANPGKAGCWAGASLTIADVFAFAYFEDLEALFPGSLSATQPLAAFRKQFAERPNIATYLKSSRRPAAIMYGPDGNKIHPQAPAV